MKDIRALQLKKHRDETGLFIAEGQKLVRDAADSGWPIEMLAYSAALAGEASVGALAAETKASGGAVLEVSAQVLEKITRRENPQNVVGVFKQRFGSEASIGREGVWVALDRVRDPGNLGTIVRTVDAAGRDRCRAGRRALRSVRARGRARDDGLDFQCAARADHARTG